MWILLEALIKIVILIAGLMTGAAYFVLLERRMAAWIQDRVGPNRVGIPLTKVRLFGLGQPLADGAKFIFKEELVPEGANRWLFRLAPALAGQLPAGLQDPWALTPHATAVAALAREAIGEAEGAAEWRRWLKEESPGNPWTRRLGPVPEPER